MLQYIRLERLDRNQHSSLLGPFVSYKENEVFSLQLYVYAKANIILFSDFANPHPHVNIHSTSFYLQLINEPNMLEHLSLTSLSKLD
jgi:hypothetical protein